MSILNSFPKLSSFSFPNRLDLVVKYVCERNEVWNRASLLASIFVAAGVLVFMLLTT